MRPLPIVIGLLLAGAVLACSGRVPAPGATLSGSVWVDRNANGVRDKCDFGLVRAGLHVQLTGANGRPLTTRVDRNGTFAFSKVSAGEYTLGIRQDRASQWPVTAPTDTETPGVYALRLNGYEKEEGFEFGVAADRPMSLYPDGYGLILVLFNDDDSDGELDVDECALPGPEGMVAVEDGERSATVVGQLSIYEFEDLRKPPGDLKPQYGRWLLDRKLVASRLDPSGCAQPTTPVAIQGSRLYSAAIGMRPAQGTATVNVGVFLDLDKNGNRDQGEPDHHLWASLTSNCEGGPTLSAARLGTGQAFMNVPSGRWLVRVSTTPPYDFDAILTTPKVVQVDVRKHDELAVGFGVTYPGAALIRVLAVSDDNGNGNADTDEPPVQGNPGAHPDHSVRVYCKRSGDARFNECGEIGGDGSAVLVPLRPGPYQLFATSGRGPESSIVEVTVGADEIVSVTIALAP